MPRAFVMHLCNRILKIQLQPGIVVVGARRRRWWWLVPNSTDGPRLPGFLLWLHFNLLAIKCTFIIGTMPAKGETPEWLLSVRIRICICISVSLSSLPLDFASALLRLYLLDLSLILGLPVGHNCQRQNAAA